MNGLILFQELGISLLVWVALAVLFFLLLREFFTWYWKINKIVKLLEQIERNTRRPEIAKQEDKPTFERVGAFTDKQL